MTDAGTGTRETVTRLHIRMPWARSDRLVPRTVLRPLQEFLDTSIAGSVLLLGCRRGRVGVGELAVERVLRHGCGRPTSRCRSGTCST